MKKLLLRSITGLLYASMIVGSLLVETKIFFTGILALFLILGLHEFYGNIYQSFRKPSNHEKTINKIIDVAFALCVLIAVSLNYMVPAIILALGYTVVRLIVQLYTKEDDPVRNLAVGYMGQFYVTLPLCALSVAYDLLSPSTLLAMFVFIWLSDTGAFCVGCTIGKHRLFERISPNKSWEGFFGGLAFCLIGGIAGYHFLNHLFPSYFNLGVWVGFSLLVAITATLGDLVESLMKRSIGVKDFGNILPGHGGILDRTDSLLLVTPATLIYFLVIINYFQ